MQQKKGKGEILRATLRVLTAALGVLAAFFLYNREKKEDEKDFCHRRQEVVQRLSQRSLLQTRQLEKEIGALEPRVRRLIETMTQVESDPTDGSLQRARTLTGSVFNACSNITQAHRDMTVEINNIKTEANLLFNANEPTSSYPNPIMLETEESAVPSVRGIIQNLQTLLQELEQLKASIVEQANEVQQFCEALTETLKKDCYGK